MNSETLLTLIFAYLAVACVALAVLVIMLRNPVQCALALVGVVFHLAGIFILLRAEFLAVAHIIIYAGAIIVLFLFTMMLLNLGVVERARQFHVQAPLAIVIGAVLFLEFIVLTGATITVGASGPHTPAWVVGQGGNVQALGQVLFRDYLLPFEVASVLLTAAVVGAIVLARQKPRRPRSSSQMGVGEWMAERYEKAKQREQDPAKPR
ncbi:MAG: NADH-quinone oxidoreductase subunit J [Chloroflexi bacterium]|nr:NADH-quinone oxidoreductase subunit J [Chloroflexota bacterium]